MSKRERQRKQSIGIAIAAMMFATCHAATAAAEEKQQPVRAKQQLTATAQSSGGTSSSARTTTQQKPMSTSATKPGIVSKTSTSTKTAAPAVKVTTSTTTKSAASVPPKSKDAASQRYAELNTDKKPTVAKTAEPPRKKARKASTTMLVPPPPPTIPTYLNVPQNSAFDLGLGFSVPAMSLDDLKFQQKNVEKKLESAKIDERDQKRLMEREQERAKQFDGLFADGIVSRRELETAKEEADRSIRKLEQSHINVAESERLLSQIKERIQALEAAKRPLKISSKKSSKRK